MLHRGYYCPLLWGRGRWHSVQLHQIEDALQEAGISLKPIRKKNSKRQYPPWEVYLQQLTRKRVEVSISLIEQLLPKSIHAVSALGFELKGLLFVIATSIKQLFEQR